MNGFSDLFSDMVAATNPAPQGPTTTLGVLGQEVGSGIKTALVLGAVILALYFIVSHEAGKSR